VQAGGSQDLPDAVDMPRCGQPGIRHEQDALRPEFAGQFAGALDAAHPEHQPGAHDMIEGRQRGKLRQG
jgi:hypothetical protein